MSTKEDTADHTHDERTLPDSPTPLKRERDEEKQSKEPPKPQEEAPADQPSQDDPKPQEDPAKSEEPTITPVPQETPNLGPPDPTLEGRPSNDTPDDDTEVAKPQVTPELAARIARASVESLEAKLKDTTLEAPFSDAIKNELERRYKAQREAKLQGQPFAVAKVLNKTMLWRDGFMSNVPAGTLVSVEEGLRLNAEGIKTVGAYAKLERDNMNVLRMVETEAPAPTKEVTDSLDDPKPSKEKDTKDKKSSGGKKK